MCHATRTTTIPASEFHGRYLGTVAGQGACGKTSGVYPVFPVGEVPCTISLSGHQGYHEEDLLAFERKYGVRSETFYAAYMSGEEPDESWVLDVSEWASVYRTWLTRQAEYRNEIHIPAPGLSFNRPNLPMLIREIESLIEDAENNPPAKRI